jgi:hypothetical protein
MLTSPHPHAQLEAIQTVPAPDPLAIDRPAFPPEQDPNPQIAEPRSGMREISNAQSEGCLILRLTLPIPGCASELGEPTGPRTTHPKRPVKPLG